VADTITVRYAGSDDGNPVAKSTVVAFDLEGSSTNTPLYTPARTTPSSGDLGPSQPSLTYYLKVDAPAGVDDARSPVFTPNSEYKYTWDNYVFPAAGSYTIRLCDASDDSVISALNTSVTVD